MPLPASLLRRLRRLDREQLVIMEIIFVVPGMGTALVQAVSQRDYPTVQAMVFVMAVVFLVVNLLVDLLYVWLDPRIHYA